MASLGGSGLTKLLACIDRAISFTKLRSSPGMPSPETGMGLPGTGVSS